MPLLGLFLLFVFIYSCRSWLKLPTFLLSYDGLLWKYARVYAPSVPIYIDGFKSSEAVGSAAVFPDFDLFIPLPVVVSMFTAESCVIFLALSRISFLVFFLTPEVPCRPLGAFIPVIPEC